MKALCYIKSTRIIETHRNENFISNYVKTFNANLFHYNLEIIPQKNF